MSFKILVMSCDKNKTYGFLFIIVLKILERPPRLFIQPET